MTIVQNFPVVKPSLLLDFANNKRLDSRITFTRTTTATYYDGVTSAKAEENLVTYSQEFDNAAWAKVNASITANSTTAPDGTSTADSFVRSGTVESVVAVNTFSSSANTYVVSVFAKASTQNFLFIQVNINSAAAASFITFDLTTGSAGTQQNLVSSVTLTASSVSVGSGWYRCIVSYTGGSTNSQVLFGAASAANVRSGTNGGIIFLWGAQLEQRSSVTAYTATTTQPITNYIPVLLTAASGVARFDHNPTTDESLGLLIEEARTNLVTYSADFSNAAWTPSGVSVSANQGVSPDGTTTADKVIPSASASQFKELQQNASITSGTTYTFSHFLKADGYRYIQLLGQGGAFGSFAINFDLVDGIETYYSAGTSTVIGRSIVGVGNGWYRVSASVTALATGSYRFAVNIIPASDSVRGTSWTGDGTSGVLFWGAQLEQGAFPTSYIATTSATVTRNADAASMTGSNFTSWFNAGEGTVYFESQSVQGTNSYPYSLFGSNTQNRIFANYNSSARITSGIRIYNIFEAVVDTPGSTAPISTFGKGATAYKVNDFGFSWNGAAALTDTSTILPVILELDIGNNGQLTGNWLNGTIKKIAYYPLRLTNANLQALTS